MCNLIFYSYWQIAFYESKVELLEVTWVHHCLSFSVPTKPDAVRDLKRVVTLEETARCIAQ